MHHPQLLQVDEPFERARLDDRQLVARHLQLIQPHQGNQVGDFLQVAHAQVQVAQVA